MEVYKDGSASVEVSRYQTPTGIRLRVRDLEKGSEIYLDAIELEGLARTESELSEERPEEMEVLKNEFAMVEVGRVKTVEGARLLVRDAASGAEIRLAPSDLERLASMHHEYFGSLLDPSELVAEGEPDPDQV